jgi:hypothetical protein
VLEDQCTAALAVKLHVLCVFALMAIVRRDRLFSQQYHSLLIFAVDSATDNVFQHNFWRLPLSISYQVTKHNIFYKNIEQMMSSGVLYSLPYMIAHS